MEIIAKISKGSKMDQIYIPKNRSGFFIGQYVIIQSVNGANTSNTVKESIIKPFFYGIKNIEPIKIKIVSEIFSFLQNKCDFENIIITGSFLEKGFNFNDIDIIIIGKDVKDLDKSIEKLTGIKTHLIFIDNKSLLIGLKTDPLYQLMLSKFVSTKRTIYKIKQEINYKLLDLNLLKSKTLIDNLDILKGNDKYYLTRNMIAILLFITNKKVNQENVNKEIKKLFNLEAEQIKENIINKKFLNRYKQIYNKTFNLIMKGVK